MLYKAAFKTPIGTLGLLANKEQLLKLSFKGLKDITEEAKENISEIHHRQPVIINQTDINRYLNLELQGSAFLKECNKPDLIFHEVSKDVNKPTNNTASLIQPFSNE